MAKATAHCRCEICGSEFVKTATKANRREADSWVEWAEEKYTVCPSCWGKQKHQEEKDAGLIAKVRLGNPYVESDSVWIVMFGDLFPIKEDLKQCGAIWTENYPEGDTLGNVVFSGLSMSRPLKRWAICLNDIEQLPNAMEKLERLGFTIQFPEEGVISTYRLIHNETKKKQAAEQEKKATAQAQKEAEQKAALEALGPKSAYSEEIHSFFPAGTTWNRKFYGKSGKYRVYISGKEVFITDEQKKEMEATLEARDAWEDKKAAILK